MTRIPAEPGLIGVQIHPGEYLAEEYLDPMGLSRRKAAEALNVSAANRSRFIAGKQSVSIELAVRLGKAFGTTAHFWLNLQQAYDLAVLRSRGWAEIEAQVRPLSA